MNPNPVSDLSTAAQAIRAFNHNSQSINTGWKYPGHTYDAIGNLAHMARMLEQAIEQATRPAEGCYESGLLRIDNNGDPNTKMAALAATAEAAKGAANALSATLDHMHSTTAPMSIALTDMPEDDDK